MGTIGRILAWWLRRLTYPALLTLLGLIGASLWVFLREPGDFMSQQRQEAQAIKAESAALQSALKNADERMLTTRTEVSAQQLRAEQAAKVAGNLDDLSSGLNRLTTSSAQLDENNQRLARMKQMETDSLKHAADLAQSLVRTQWEKDGIEIALERNRAKLATVSVETSVPWHYARVAWVSYWKGILIGVVLVMLGPAIWRLFRAK